MARRLLLGLAPMKEPHRFGIRTSILTLSLAAFAAVGCEVDLKDRDDAGDVDDDDDDDDDGKDGGSTAGRNGTGGRGNTPQGGRGNTDAGASGDESPGGAPNGGAPGDETGDGDDEPGDEEPGPGDGPAQTARFFLPTGEPTNTAAPTVEVDARGRIHAVYPGYAIGGAFYATCAGDCTSSDAMSVVRFETQGTVHNSMLALDAKGRPRVLLSTMSKVYFASCDEDCDDAENWTTTELMDHAGKREVTGEAFAIDPDGGLHFMMHTYRALFGLGQDPRRTWYLSCESDCHDPDAWNEVQIATQTWEGTHLRFDAQGRAHIATVANIEEDGVVTNKLGAYATCEADCDVDTNWVGTGLYPAYENMTAAIRMQPTVSLALTRAGTPRVAVFGRDEEGNRNIVYFECDENCTGSGWVGAIITNNDRLDAGLDLALDRQDRPRFAFTLDYNIGLYYCDEADCTSEDAKWDLTKVEFGSDIPTDEIFLWDNCTVAAWFLHSPSIAIDANGQPRIGYQARDISGGVTQPDPTRPRCVAGTDMTWSRLAVMPSHQ